MEIIRWLESFSPSFKDLGNEELQVILEFTLLWSLFESKALENFASVHKIQIFSESWVNSGFVTDTKINAPLNYFNERYIKNGSVTTEFNGLRFRSNDKSELVRLVLMDCNQSLANKVTALFIIIYRLRNNLFHGEKWAYGFRDQYNNFNHANYMLKLALENYHDL